MKNVVDNKTEWKANPERPEYDETRLKIIEAAANIIDQKGWKKLRFEQVAKEVGCARPTLYRYFNSKEELISAVLIHLMLKVASEITEAIPKNIPVRDVLVEVTYLGASYLRDESQYNILMDPENIQELTRMALVDMPKVISPRLEQRIVKTHKGNSPFAEDLSLEEVSRWLVMQIITLAQFGPVEKTPDDERAFISKMVIASLLK